MEVDERQPGDLATLNQRVSRERDAEQRDRLRAAALAIAGEPTRVIQDKLGRSRGFVQRWAYAYRAGGVEALRAGRPPGASSKLTPQQEQAFHARMLAGPTAADGGRCTLRGTDAQRILADEFGQPYSLPGVYDLLHRLGLSCLKPRPRHRKNDPAAMAQWRADAPLLSSGSATSTPTNGSKSGARTKPASDNRAR
jgi:putative transposase